MPKELMHAMIVESNANTSTADTLHSPHFWNGQRLKTDHTVTAGAASFGALGYLRGQNGNMSSSFQSRQPHPSERHQSANMVEKPVRVLVMDDAPVVRQLIVDLLEELSGVDRVLEAQDAPTAVAVAARDKPQIAILDIKVPGAGILRNGIDVLRQLKKMLPDMKVIMLTNHATSRYKDECMSAGASFFFDKSNEFDELPLVVEKLVRNVH